MAAADNTLAAACGVSASIVAGLRATQLIEGEHWIREATGRIAYTDTGKARIRVLLTPPAAEKKEGAGEAPQEPPPPDPDPPPAAPIVLPPTAPAPGPARTLPVARLYPNPIFAGVRLPDGSLAEVRVRRATALRAGVLLQCRQWPDGRWECVQHGQAVPLSPDPSQPAS